MSYYLFKNYMACGSLFGVCLRIYIKRQSIPLVGFAHSLSQPVFFFFFFLMTCYVFRTYTGSGIKMNSV